MYGGLREGTWDGLWLDGSPEGHGRWLGFALVVLRYHVDVVLRVPLQPPEDNVLAVAGHPDLWLPLRRLELRGDAEACFSLIIVTEPLRPPPHTHWFISDQVM